MKKTIKTLAALVLGAAMAFTGATASYAYNQPTDPETETEAIETEGVTGMIEVPSDTYFYQHVISRDGDVMSDIPVIIDFNATWCGPCQKLKPILQRIANQYDGEIRVFSVDIDRVHAQDKFFDFESIPYVVFLTPDGDWDDMEGFSGEQQIKAKISSVFGL